MLDNKLNLLDSNLVASFLIKHPEQSSLLSYFSENISSLIFSYHKAFEELSILCSCSLYSISFLSVNSPSFNNIDLKKLLGRRKYSYKLKEYHKILGLIIRDIYNYLVFLEDSISNFLKKFNDSLKLNIGSKLNFYSFLKTLTSFDTVNSFCNISLNKIRVLNNSAHKFLSRLYNFESLIIKNNSSVNFKYKTVLSSIASTSDQVNKLKYKFKEDLYQLNEILIPNCQETVASSKIEVKNLDSAKNSETGKILCSNCKKSLKLKLKDSKMSSSIKILKSNSVNSDLSKNEICIKELPIKNLATEVNLNLKNGTNKTNANLNYQEHEEIRLPNNLNENPINEIRNRFIAPMFQNYSEDPWFN